MATPIHMVRQDPIAFCGAEGETFACHEPGCEEHAPLVTCEPCKARPETWDYSIRHALRVKAERIEAPRRKVFSAAVFVRDEWISSEYRKGSQLVAQFYCMHPERALAMANREADAQRKLHQFVKVSRPGEAFEVSRAFDRHFGARIDAGEVLSVKPGWWRGCECGCRELMPADGWSVPA